MKSVSEKQPSCAISGTSTARCTRAMPSQSVARTGCSAQSMPNGAMAAMARTASSGV